MAVVSFENLTERIRNMLGETPDDAGVQLLEDVSDTLATDWQAKYTENDQSWRKRYTSRFGSGPGAPPGGDPNDVPSPTTKMHRIEDLFTRREKVNA